MSGPPTFSGYWYSGTTGTNASTCQFTPNALSFFINGNDEPSSAISTAIVLASATTNVVFGFSFSNVSAGEFGFQCGPANNAGNIGTATGAVVAQPSGNIYTLAGELFNVPGVTNQIFFAVRPGNNFLASPDCVTWYDGLSSYTTAQVAAGDGGHDITGLVDGGTPISPIAQYYSSSSTGEITFIGGNFPAATPSGFSTVVGGLYTKLRPAAPGGTVTVDWACSTALSGELQFATTPNASTWVNCGGGNTGTSGVATAGTEPTGENGLSTWYYFRDSGATYNQSVPQPLFVITPPSGSGSLVAWDSGFWGASAQGITTYEFIGGAYLKVYWAGALADGDYPTSPLFNFCDADNVVVDQVGYSTQFESRLNLIPQALPTEFTGSTSAHSPVGTTTLMYLTLDATGTSGSSASGTASLVDLVNSTTGSTSVGTWAGTNIPKFDHGVMLDTYGPGDNAFGQSQAFAVWAPPPAEVLTLTSASIPAVGTLSVSGVTEYATLTDMSISHDDGVTYAAATSLSVSGTNYTATLDVILSAGSSVIYTQDASTSVISNPYTLSVSGETITLTHASGSTGNPVEFSGTTTGGTSSAMQVSLNGGTFGATSAYTPGASFSGASEENTPSTSSVTVQVRDSTNQYVVSNIYTFAAVPETITITTVAGTLNSPLDIGGITNGGPPTGMNISVNNGLGYSAGGSYTTTSTGTNDVYSVEGPALTAYGTYTLRAQDNVNTTVVSAPFTFILQESNTGAGPLSEFLYPQTGPYAGLIPNPTIIPLSNYAQTFNISLAGVTYNFRTYWDPMVGGWFMDFSDVNNNPLIQGLPLTTGLDLFQQYQYLDIGGALFVITNGDYLAPPTLENLGSNAQLFFVTYSEPPASNLS